MGVIHFNEENFEQEVLKSPGLALVDFWAEWCGPCRMMGPIIDDLAKEFDGQMKIGKVNVDEAQKLAIKYSVMSIPTLILFKDGQSVDQSVGVVSKDQLVKKINELLN